MSYKDSTGRWRTKSMFIETIMKEQLAAGYEPVYSLKDDPSLPSLREIYIEEGDPTEYRFALRAFGSWEHFKKLESLQWFKMYLDLWRQELEVSLRSAGVRAMVESAARDGARGLSAAKFLAEKGWEGKKRGRPSKDEIQREKRIQARMEEDLHEDAQRLLN